RAEVKQVVGEAHDPAATGGRGREREVGRTPVAGVVRGRADNIVLKGHRGAQHLHRADTAPPRGGADLAVAHRHHVPTGVESGRHGHAGQVDVLTVPVEVAAADPGHVRHAADAAV